MSSPNYSNPLSDAASAISLELFRDRMKDQTDTLRGLATKASIMVGIAAVLGMQVLPDSGAWPDSWMDIVFLIGIYTGFGVCVALGLLAIIPRNYQEGPSVEKIKEALSFHEIDTAREWIARVYGHSCKKNVELLNKSGALLYWGVIALIFAIFLQIVYRAVTHFA